MAHGNKLEQARRDLAESTEILNEGREGASREWLDAAEQLVRWYREGYERLQAERRAAQGQDRPSQSGRWEQERRRPH